MNTGCRITFYCILIYLVVFLMYGANVFAIGSKQKMLFDLSQSQYITKSTVDNQNDQYTKLSLNYDFEKSQDSWYFKSVAAAQLAMNYQDGGLLAVPEFYAQYNFVNKNKIILGRYKHNWSELENYWRLDMWQPQIKWDYLRPETQGIVGLFYQTQLKPWNLTFFYSPVFLPEQGPEIEVENGVILSRSRWFKPPVSQVEVVYGRSNVYYDLQLPEYLEILAHSGYGFQATNGRLDKGLFVSASYAHKPMNQFHLGIKTKRIHKMASGQLNPVLVPMVVRHHISTLETSYAKRDYKITAAVTSEVPEQPVLQQGWEQTDLNSHYYAGIIMSTRFNWDRLSTFKVGIIKHDIFKNPISNTGFVKGDFAAPTQRFMFDKALSVQWQRQWLRGNLATDLEYIYSVVDDGGLLAAGLNYEPKRQVSWYVRLDILGANNLTKDNTFLSYYRSNDRVEGGVKYVF